MIACGAAPRSAVLHSDTQPEGRENHKEDHGAAKAVSHASGFPVVMDTRACQKGASAVRWRTQRRPWADANPSDQCGRSSDTEIFTASCKPTGVCSI